MVGGTAVDAVGGTSRRGERRGVLMRGGGGDLVRISGGMVYILLPVGTPKTTSVAGVGSGERGENFRAA
jgi:hypothetical protein